METIFLVPDSGEHKRRLRKRNEGAESQAERNFGCHVTGLLNVQFGCLPSCTMYPTSLCALKAEQESIPWRKKKKHISVHPENKVMGDTSQGSREVTAVWTKCSDRKKVHKGCARLVFCFPAMDKRPLCYPFAKTHFGCLPLSYVGYFFLIWNFSVS